MSFLRANVVLAVAGVLSFGLTAALHSARSPADQAEVQGGDLYVEWAFRPDDLDSLASHSDAVVVGRVTAVAAGEPLVLDPATGTHVGTQLVDVHVDELEAGEAPGELTLFKVGGQGIQPDDDGAYHVGENYLLFVSRRVNTETGEPLADGTYIATAPDGRLEETDDGALESYAEGALPDQLEGATIETVTSQIDPAEVGTAGE